MKLELSTMKYYFLTCDNQKRRQHIIEQMHCYDLQEINPQSTKDGISKVQSGATGMMRILDKATKDQDRSKPFQPFMILEDDVKWYRDSVTSLEIPDDADLLYTGISNFGITHVRSFPNVVCCQECPRYDGIARIKNMLSTHSIVVCSMYGLLTLQKCFMEDYFKNRPYDTTIAFMQPFINAYALAKPLFYQCAEMGGQERATKLAMTDKDYSTFFNKEMPEIWRKMDTVSFQLLAFLWY